MIRVSVLALVLAAGCSASKSPRCKAMCEREAQCVAEREQPEARFDEGECVVSCSALERDDEGRELVDRHEACLEEATSCADVFACD